MGTFIFIPELLLSTMVITIGIMRLRGQRFRGRTARTIMKSRARPIWHILLPPVRYGGVVYVSDGMKERHRHPFKGYTREIVGNEPIGW